MGSLPSPKRAALTCSLDNHSYVKSVKRLVPYVLIVFFAALVVAVQPLLVYGGDDFTFTQDQHKLFTYGFPLRINDSPHSSLHTPPSQVRLRFASNFAF